MVENVKLSVKKWVISTILIESCLMIILNWVNPILVTVVSSNTLPLNSSLSLSTWNWSSILSHVTHVTWSCDITWSSLAQVWSISLSLDRIILVAIRSFSRRFWNTDWNSYRASWVHRTKTKTIGRCPGINHWSHTYRILHIETISRKLSSRQGQGQIRHSKRFSQNAKTTKISKNFEFRKTI